MRFIVLDQGSSSLRALLFDKSGKITAQKSAPFLPRYSPPANSEYDADALFEKQKELLDALLSDISPAQDLCLSVTSQRSTVVFWNKKTARALACYSWHDNRAIEENKTIEMPQQEVHRLSGLYKTAAFSAPKIMWALKHEPKVKEAADKGELLAAPLAGFIIWRLTQGKVFAADPTLAQRTLLFNINTLQWDQDLLAAYGVKKEWLPEIKDTVSDYGSYKNIPIKVCVGDQQASSLSLGVLRKGDACANYGSGAFFLVNSGAELKTVPGILTSAGICTKERKEYLLEGVVNAAGAVLQWFKEIGIDFDFKELDALYATAQKPALFMPSFGGLGSPYWDTDTPTVLTGLTPQTKKADVLAGALQSTAFLISDIYYYLLSSGVEIKNIFVSGGLAQSGALMQFQSDILQKEILHTTRAEATAMGAARLAAHAAGVDVKMWDDIEVNKTYKPQISKEAAREKLSAWRSFTDYCHNAKTSF